MAEITRLLRAASRGDEKAMDAVFAAVHPQLKQLAAGQMMVRPGQTLTPTAVVNETYLKLIQAEQLELVDRRHFMICAAKAMRHIVIDYARARSAKRRGGDSERVLLGDIVEGAAAAPEVDLMDLDQALEDLHTIDPDLRELIELKFFVGLNMREISELLGTSLRTVNRNWSRARAFLNTRMS